MSYKVWRTDAGPEILAALKAAYEGDLPAVRALIEEDPRHIELILLLLDEEENVKGQTLLLSAVTGRSFAVGEYLMDQGMDVNLVLKPWGNNVVPTSLTTNPTASNS